MSDQSDLYYSRLGPIRQPGEVERALIAKMVKDTPYENNVTDQLRDAVVQDMPDGGMGSIKFKNESSHKATYGRQIAEGAFRDVDGMPVSVTLSLDDDGRLFELDVFKADGSRLVRYPALDDFEIVKRQRRLGYE